MGWYTEDDGGPVANLDDAFKNGHAPKLHGMLKRFTEADTSGPVYIDRPALQFARNDEELRSTTNGFVIEIREEDVNADATLYPILQGSAHGDGSRDLTVEEFFYHADILTGQDVGAVKPYADRIPEGLELQSGGWITRAVDVLEGTRNAHKEYDLLDIFGEGNSWWSDNWSDTQGRNAEQFCRHLDIWNDPYRLDALSVLSDSMVRFGSIIHGARLDLNNLMGECVEQIEAFDAEVSPPFDEIAWKALNGIAGVVTAGARAPMVAMHEMQGILNDQKMKSSSEPPPGYYGMLIRYLEKADQLLTDTVDAVDALKTNMTNNFKIWYEAPTPRW